MDNKILAHVRALASVSEEARAIAERMGVSLASDDAELLKQRVRELTIQIKYLEHELMNPEVPEISDEERDKLMQDLSQCLKTSKPDDLLAAYSYTWFRLVPQSVRLVIANELVNHFTTIGISAPVLWTQLVNRQGVL